MHHNNKKKMKKVLLVIVVVFCFAINSLAQTTIVKGIVLDSLTHEPKPYATVRIFRDHKTERPSSAGITDIKGKFSQKINGKGLYMMYISSMGRKDIVREVNLNNSTIDFGTLLITNDVKTLDGVVVKGQKPLVKMEADKMTYNVSNDVDSKSSTVLDMLRKVPMVTVDGQDNITVNGSGNFKVYVNGKPNLMISSNPSQVFKMMPASAVQNIEVITNPGAKYDAEGTGGVLNIIMSSEAARSQKTDNYNITLTGNGGTMPTYGGGVYAAMQKGKFSASMNMSSQNVNNNNVTSDMTRQQMSQSGTSSINSSTSLDNKIHYNMANLSMSYEIDSLRLLSGTFGLSKLNHNQDNTGNTDVLGLGSDSEFGYKSFTNDKDNRYSINGSIDYQRQFAHHKGRMLTLSYMISSTPDKTKALNTFNGTGTSYYNLGDRYTDAHTNTLEHTVQVDYTNPIDTKSSVDMGLKYIRRNNSSISDYFDVAGEQYTKNNTNSIDYRHINDIAAAYAEYNFKTALFNVKAGLRYEHTWQNVKYYSDNGDNFKLNYGNLVPSASVSYNLGMTGNIGLTYNMRISRPGIAMLNPYINRTDPTSLSYGNTDLDCEKSHTISAVYNYFTPKVVVNLTLRQSICNNSIAQYSSYENNILNTTYGNVVKNQQTGLNTFISWSPTAATRFMINGGMAYVNMKSNQLGYKNDGWQGNCVAGLQQTMPLNIRLGLNFIANTKSYNLQGWTSGYNIGVISLSRSFLKDDRLSISAMAISPLSGKNLKIDTYSEGTGFNTRNNLNIDLRMVNFTVTYKLGHTSSVKKTQRTINNTDIKQVESTTNSVDQILIK